MEVEINLQEYHARIWTTTILSIHIDLGVLYGYELCITKQLQVPVPVRVTVFI
jgi:hypothetical protein